MESKNYFEVDVTIGSQSTVATMNESAEGQFGLMYGGAKFLNSTHNTLKATIADFESCLRDDKPDQTVVIGQPRTISRDQAEKNKPNDWSH